MIVHQCLQNSPEWHRLRAGIVTASEVKRIITPKTCELSKQADGYLYHLLAEYMVGHPITGIETDAMARGTALEGPAAERFSFETDMAVEPIGFLTTDDGMIGCSPDRKVVCKNEICEIKCPSEEVHVRYLLTGAIADEYRPQIQTQLYVGGYDCAWAISYHPELPLCAIKVERDEPFIAKLAMALSAFVEVLLEKRALLAKLYGPFTPIIGSPDAEPMPDNLGVSDADLDMIYRDSFGRVGV